MARTTTAARPRSKADRNDERPALKIALLLPSRYELRTVRRAIEFAKALLSAETTVPAAVEVAIGLAEPNEKQWRTIEQWIRHDVPTAVVRHLEWTRVPVANARRMFAQLPAALDLEGITEVSVPRDWGWNFVDCDAWITFADPGIGAVLPLRPTIHYCGDLAERYVPLAVAPSIHDPYWDRQTDAFRMWRQAMVITTDSDTARDLVSYAGVRRERIELIPDILEMLPPSRTIEGAVRDSNEVIWLVRGNALDDLESALLGLSIYQREGGKLNVCIAYDYFALPAEHPSLAMVSADLRETYEGLKKIPYRSLEELDRIVARAGLLWSSQAAGGEAEHVRDAARAGLPLIAPQLPLNENKAQELGTRAKFYKIGDALALSDALWDAERNATTARIDKSSPKDCTQERRAEFGFLIDRMLEDRRGN